jgi:hypothetical protein
VTTVVVTFFGAPQAKNKKRMRWQLLLPSLVHRKQKLKKEGDDNYCRLPWCVTTKKQKKR